MSIHILGKLNVLAVLHCFPMEYMDYLTPRRYPQSFSILSTRLDVALV